MEPFSIGAVVAAGMRLGAKSFLRLAPVIVLIGGPLVVVVAMGGGEWMPLALVLEVPVAAMVSHAVVGELSGRRPGVRASIGAGLRRLVPASGVMAVACLVSGALGVGLLMPVFAADDRGGYTMLVVFAAWLAIVLMLYSRWFVAIPAIVVERIGVVAALRRSTQLTTGRRREIAGILVVLAATFVGGSLVVELCWRVRRSVWFFDERAAPAVAAAGLVLWTMIAVLRASFAAAAYHHLRQDAEGASPEKLDEIFR